MGILTELEVARRVFNKINHYDYLLCGYARNWFKLEKLLAERAHFENN